jgi:hypothetical protein
MGRREIWQEGCHGREGEGMGRKEWRKMSVSDEGEMKMKLSDNERSVAEGALRGQLCSTD